MTQEVGAPVVDLPEEWFERSQRSLSDLRFRLEHQRRELEVKEAELEVRARDLQGRGERLRDAFRAAEETSQDLMARSHRMREQQRELSVANDALIQDQAEVAKARQSLEARTSELARRESVLAEGEKRVKDREAVLARTERDLERTRQEQQRTLASAREVLAARVRDLEVEPRSDSYAGEGDRDVLPRLLELKAELEATIARVRSREGEAESLLSQAAERAVEVRQIEGRIHEQQDRLDGMRVEIVNAKRALMTVDQVLARMPYEIVDDFTKTEDFEAYEHAVRILKRFEESPGRGS